MTRNNLFAGAAAASPATVVTFFASRNATAVPPSDAGQIHGRQKMDDMAAAEEKR
jgi:hypothetical protein